MEHLNPLEDPTGGVFVNREYELDLFWTWATSVPKIAQNSFALVGLRRTGKTAILRQVFNRLFYEQKAVMPVYISFAAYLRSQPITIDDFFEEHFIAYLRSYLAFQYRTPDLFSPDITPLDLHDFAQEQSDELASTLYTRYERLMTQGTPHSLIKWAINFPRGIARRHQIPTAIMIDEFQILTNVYCEASPWDNPKNQLTYDLTNGFQDASETRWAPLLVSGSSISMLVGKALGGMLSGRFKTRHLEPLSREHTHDLVARLGAQSKISVTKELAEAIWLLTLGYPYSIRSLMNSPSPARQRYPDLSALGEVFLFELTHQDGQLRNHYQEEFGKACPDEGRVVQQLNDTPTTQQVMLWATKYPDQQIDVEHVAKELDKPEEEIRAALEKLHWVDVVRKSGLISYSGPNDPMMRRFVAFQYKREIEKLTLAEAKKEWEKELESLRGHLSRQKGIYAEVHVGAVMRCFDGREVDGRLYFNSPHKINLPSFERVEQRGGVVVDGIMVEVDLIGEWSESSQNPSTSSGHRPSDGQCAWLVQVRYTEKEMGIAAINKFLQQVKLMKAKIGYAKVISWYVCRGGFTKEAAQTLAQEGCLFSKRAEFQKLANLFGFFGFPT